MPVVLLVVYNEQPYSAGDALLTVSEADLCHTVRDQHYFLMCNNSVCSS